MAETDTLEATVSGKKLPKPNRKMLEMLDRYRSHHNPLRGLSMSLAVRLLEEGNRGAYADLQWLYKFAERGYEPLKACKGKMSDSIVKLDYNFKYSDKLPEEMKPMAERQVETLRMEYDRIVNFRKALRHLTTGFFRGYAHCEKMWTQDPDGSWHITRLVPVPQWHWVRDGILGEWEFNPDSQGGVNKGVPVDLSKFVYMEVEDPIDYSAIIRFIRANMAEKDWGSWLEEFGIPHKYANLPEMGDDKDKLQEFVDYIEKAFSRSSGALPHGSELNVLEPKGQGTDAFEKAIDHHAEMVVLATTNSKLTMLAESGSGTLGGNAHADTWDDVVEARAMDISEAFQEHLDRQILARLHPGEPVLAYFELAAEDEVDAKAVAEVVRILDAAGYEMDADELSEKLGFVVTKKVLDAAKEELAKKGDAAKGKRGEKSNPDDEDKETVKNRESNLRSATIPAGGPEVGFGAVSLDMVSRALAEVNAPLRKRLEEAEAAGDWEDAKQILEAVLADAGEMFEAASQREEVVSAISDVLMSSVANGADEGDGETKATVWNRAKDWLRLMFVD